MAIMYINDLIIEAKHGVHQHEKNNSQRFKVSVTLTVNIARAGVSDDLADTLDWSDLRRKIISVVQNNTFNLIERLAQEVADSILIDQRVEKVGVTIDKLDAFPDCIPGIKLEVKQSSAG